MHILAQDADDVIKIIFGVVFAVIGAATAPPGRQHVVGAGREGVLPLVRHRRRDAPRAEGIEDEGGQPRAGERLGMREMHGRRCPGCPARR